MRGRMEDGRWWHGRRRVATDSALTIGAGEKRETTGGGVLVVFRAGEKREMVG